MKEKIRPTLGKKFFFTHKFTQDDFNKFAQLSKDTNPIHVDPVFSSKTKFGRTVAHGMFLYANIWRALETILPDSGFIQLWQDLIFPNPTYAEENIIELNLTNIIHSKGIYEFDTVIKNLNGDFGLQGSTKIVVLSSKLKVFWPQKSSLKSEYQTELSEPFKGLRIGQLDTISQKITLSDLKNYISLLKSSNLTYSDPEFIKKVGFDDFIVPAPLLGGIISHQLGTRLPGRGTNWLKLKISFFKPVYINKGIKVTLKITRIRPEKDLVNLTAMCYNELNELVADADILVLIKDLEIS